MEKQGLTKNSGQSAVRHITVGEDDAGSRLDKFLARHYPEVARTRLFRIVRKGEVRVNGKRAGIDTRLALGDEVRLPPVRLEAPETSPGSASVGGDTGRGVAAGATPVRRPRVPASLIATVTGAILHEDERLLVINKPAGLAVHGGSGLSFGVIEALRAARPEEAE